MKKSSLQGLGHDFKFSTKMGSLYPITCFDVVPGDRIGHKITAILRTQPLLAPLMHTVDVDIHVYYCPDRLVWPEVEEFHTGGDDGLSDIEWPHMEIPEGGYDVGSLADALGLPLGVGDGQFHSALPFRHYANIYNHHYRDSQIQAEVAISTASGLDTTTSVEFLYPCWKRDYFTSARPQPQLGPEVAIPLTGNAPVVGIGVETTASWGQNTTVRYSDGSTVAETDMANANAGTGRVMVKNDGSDFPDIQADLSDISAVDVRDLRESSAVERFLEFNNIFGSTYYDQIRARFGVPISDYRLQRPEFLGSGHTKIQFSEVLQTAEGTDPVGEMRGHGISIVGSNRYKYKVPEHGWVFVMLIVRPKTQYMQGMHKSWSRQTRYDYIIPEFVGIGDQAVLNKELYTAHATPDGVFGYVPRYEEYRTIPSRVAGDFRTTLKYWHMAREFSSDPALNTTFLTCNPTTRVWPAASEDNLYVTVNHDLKMRRKIPKRAPYFLK